MLHFRKRRGQETALLVPFCCSVKRTWKRCGLSLFANMNRKDAGFYRIKPVPVPKTFQILFFPASRVLKCSCNVLPLTELLRISLSLSRLAVNCSCCTLQKRGTCPPAKPKPPPSIHQQEATPDFIPKRPCPSPCRFIPLRPC